MIVRPILLSFVLTLLFTNSSSAQTNQPDLEGVWKTSYVSLDDPRWTIADLGCGGWCSLEAYRYLQSLLDNPENNNRPVKDLLNEAQDHGKKHLDSLLTPCLLYTSDAADE